MESGFNHETDKQLKNDDLNTESVSFSGICRITIKNGVRFIILQWLVFELAVYWYIRMVAISLSLSHKIAMILLNPLQIFYISVSILSGENKMPSNSGRPPMKQSLTLMQPPTRNAGKRSKSEEDDESEGKSPQKKQKKDEDKPNLVQRFPFYYVQMMKRLSLIEYFQKEISLTMNGAFDDFVALPDKAETIFNRYLKKPNASVANINNSTEQHTTSEQRDLESNENDISDSVLSYRTYSSKEKKDSKYSKEASTKEIILTPNSPARYISHTMEKPTEEKKGKLKDTSGHKKVLVSSNADSSFVLSESLSAKLSEVITDTAVVANKNFEPKKISSDELGMRKTRRLKYHGDDLGKQNTIPKHKAFNPSDYYGSIDQPLQIINSSSPRGIKLINVELPNKQKSSFKLKITPKPSI